MVTEFWSHINISLILAELSHWIFFFFWIRNGMHLEVSQQEKSRPRATANCLMSYYM